ncbi:MAG TPA: SRPBCC family protein [Mycobacteriales bacterium]|nr:SRPBCC family protein [Mycobacteriales bacterium]
MKQELTTDRVSRHIEARPEALYSLVSDVTRTPEYSPEVVKCTWIKGATGPVVGARFKAINHAGRVPDWPNKPVVTVADAGRAFAFERSEVGGGTIEWRYTFEPEGTGTLVTESYTVLKPVNALGWFIIDTLAGLKDRESDLRRGMTESLDRIAAIVERSQDE